MVSSDRQEKKLKKHATCALSVHTKMTQYHATTSVTFSDHSQKGAFPVPYNKPLHPANTMFVVQYFRKMMQHSHSLTKTITVCSHL